MNADEIRAALAAATPGPWNAEPLGSEGYVVTGAPDPDAHGVRAKMRRRIARFGYQDWDTDRANAELVANAPTWLAELLAEVDSTRRELGDVHVSLYSEIAMLTARAEAAEQAVQRVRELHTPEVAYDSEHHDCEPSECDRAGEGEPYERCAHCSGFAWEQLWPCTTIRALDGGEQHG